VAAVSVFAKDLNAQQQANFWGGNANRAYHLGIQ